MSEQLRAGVIGVGHMGTNHARIYRELPEAELVGVHDADRSRSEEVADEFDTTAMALPELLSRVDVVSVAVPTVYHAETVRGCLDAGVHVLVEKPFVDDLSEGRALVELANERDLALQVGHVERFNPAVQTLADLRTELDVISITANRLGPPVDRAIEDTVVFDLMVHDLDIVLSMLEADVASVCAAGSLNGEYTTATLQAEDEVIGRLTASRVTQEKVRELTITAAECRVKLDYTAQSIEIHRSSLPEYVKDGDGVHHRHESVVEQLYVEKREPLKNELASFIDAARTGREPLVTGEDGIRVLELAREIERSATRSTEASQQVIEL